MFISYVTHLIVALNCCTLGWRLAILRHVNANYECSLYSTHCLLIHPHYFKVFPPLPPLPASHCHRLNTLTLTFKCNGYTFKASYATTIVSATGKTFNLTEQIQILRIRWNTLNNVNFPSTHFLFSFSLTLASSWQGICCSAHDNRGHLVITCESVHGHKRHLKKVTSFFSPSCINKWFFFFLLPSDKQIYCCSWCI